jgi:hypothetical protein
MRWIANPYTLVRLQLRAPISVSGGTVYTAASKAAPLTGLKVRLLPDAPAWQSGGTVYTLVLETSALIGLRVQVSPLSP